MKITSVFQELNAGIKKHRTVILYGGSSSSKTISTLQWLTIYALKHPKKVVTLVAESMPVIKKTIFHDWKEVVMDQTLFDSGNFTKMDMTFTFPNGTIFQFVPADDSARFHAMRQDVLYIDEAYYVKKDVFDQAEIRTREKVIMTFNPRGLFWAKDLFEQEDVYVHHSTYKHNPYVENSIVKALEKRSKTDPNFHRVYTLGEWGSLEGLIYKEGLNWKIIKDWPEEFEWVGYGLDFGYSDHASALVMVGMLEMQLYAKQIFWRSGMKTRDIYDECKITNNEVIAADGAEDRLIDELADMGLNIFRCKKGPGSVKYGTNLVKQYNLNIHQSSLDLIRDFRNYKRKKNRSGEYLDEPVKLFDEGPDAIRYIADWMLSEQPDGRYFIS